MNIIKIKLQNLWEWPHHSTRGSVNLKSTPQEGAQDSHCLEARKKRGWIVDIPETRVEPNTTEKKNKSKK